MLVIAAVTSIARKSLLPAGSNRVMSPVPAGIPDDRACAAHGVDAAAVFGSYVAGMRGRR